MQNPKVPEKPRIVDGGAIASQHVMPFGMTMDQLQRSYDSIISASAIYYPVAYQFVRELGRGRQGRVFLALRQGARGCITEHAIKIFDPSLYRSPSEYWTDMGRIATQISRMHQMQSPNLVSRYSYDETYGIGYIEMEALDGFDLRRLIQKGEFEKAKSRSGMQDAEWSRFTSTIFRRTKDGVVALQPGTVVYILRGVLRGLERLHASGFLHCDIKPGNIMVDRLGTIKVVDFGRAVVVGERLSFLLGSPMYMSPEMHRREACGPQSDIFSLGLVALEMLCGKPIADSEHDDEASLLKAKLGLCDRLHELLPGDVLSNKHLVSIIRRFLHPEPRRRYATARDADVGEQGLRIIDKQLVQAGLDSEYSRDLSEYLNKQVNEHTGRVDIVFED